MLLRLLRRLRDLGLWRRLVLRWHLRDWGRRRLLVLRGRRRHYWLLWWKPAGRALHWRQLTRGLWRLTLGLGLRLLRSLLSPPLRFWSRHGCWGTLLRRRGLAGALTLALLLLHRGWLLSFALLTRLLHYRWLLALRLTLTGSRLLPTLPPLLLVVLPRYRVLRPIAVVLRVDDSLLLHSRISIS
jgi:hypothetical protein